MHNLCKIILERRKNFFMYKKDFLLKAIILAEGVKGLTSPNPAVGCVIEKNGKIISEGATQKSGCDHAEVVAIKNAKESLKGSTMYVTLEPCINYPLKKTPSCAEKIIESGIKEVIIGMEDPNPNVKGKGIELLKKAGLKVKLADDFKERLFVLNEDFAKFINTGLPFVYLKVAMTLDGNIATINGDSKWISCEESRKYVHSLRNKVDAILVGVNTVLQDNPELNVRLVEKKKDPTRIVIDPFGKTTENFNVMADNLPTIFVTRKDVSPVFVEKCQSYGKEILQLMTDENGLFSFREIFTILGNRNISSLMIEGGSRVYKRVLSEKLADKLIIFLAPKLFLGRGVPFLYGDGVAKVIEAIKIKDISVENIGEDILIQGYL